VRTFRHPSRSSRHTTQAAFTLAEVAVTIAIIGIALVLVLQGINVAKLEAAYTRNLKTARELALLTLGEIESGVFEEDADRKRLFGSYAEQGYPDFEFEAVLGEENFIEDEYENDRYDPWRRDSNVRREDDEEDDEDAKQPYEKIRIKVVYPKIRGYPDELVLERWVSWDQVYAEDEGEEQSEQEPGEQ
jgi:prepilin-type N-terminal cleavage/methylation domain-containing protein